MSDGIAPANPAVNHTQSVDRLGSDATGTESAAESFTRFLEEDEAPKPDPQSRPARRANAEKRARKAESDGADDGESPGRQRQPDRERGERRQEQQDDDPLHDPILDGDAPEEDGDNSDETDDTDEEGVEPEADGDDEDEGDEDPEFEVTVAGVPTKVKQSELLASYSRESDYRQKTEAHARDVEQVTQFATDLNQRRGQVDTLTQMAEDLIASLLPKQEEWDALKNSNPQAFIQAQEQWNGFISKASELRAARDQTKTHQDEEQGTNYNRYVADENRKLFEKVPALRNPKVQKQFSDTIFGYGKKMGYSQEELAKGLVNHRDVMTAYYAAKYLEIQESRRANKRQAERKGPRESEGNSTPRAVQTQRGRDNSQRMNRQRQADRELQRTGTVQSASVAFANMFRD